MAVCGHKDLNGCTRDCVCTREVKAALFCLECGRGKVIFNSAGHAVCSYCGSHMLELGDPVLDLPDVVDYRAQQGL